MVHMLTLASYPLRNLAITRDFATCLGSTGKGAAVRCARALGERPNWGTKAFGLIIGWAVGAHRRLAIIVLVNVAEIAAIYTLRFSGLDDLAGPGHQGESGSCSLRS